MKQLPNPTAREGLEAKPRSAPEPPPQVSRTAPACTLRGPTPDLEVQNLRGWGPRICIAACFPETPLHIKAWESLCWGSSASKTKPGKPG